MTRSLRFLAPLALLLLASPEAAAQDASGARGLADAVAEAGGSEALARAVAATVTEDETLAASDVDGLDRFGRSVALSGDRALVGAFTADCAAGGNCGAVYVFELSGGSWAESATLTASDAAQGDFFGISVALSGDRALVGAVGDDCAAGSDCGAAYVFDFGGATWAETAKLTASDAARSDQFGRSVALSGDRALVGAIAKACAAGSFCGAAYVFDFDGAAWTETKLTASDADRDDFFGGSVALSGDRALVGANGDDCAAGPGCGAAYVFDLDGAAWAETKLTASDAVPNAFGVSVALSGDRALVGAFSADCAAGSFCGAAYVLDFDGAAWAETKLTASDADPFDYFGTSVALSGDRALVGAGRADCAAGEECGAAYAFELSGGTWAETKLAASDAAADDEFGRVVALSGDRALVGAPYAACAAGVQCGSVYAFGLAPALPEVTIEYISSTADPQRGDHVFIRARATNHEAFDVPTRVYFEVTDPNDETRRYSVLSTDFPAGLSIQVQKVKQLKFRLGGSAPAGTYTVTLFVSEDQAAGGAVYDSDTFTFDLPPMDPKTASGALASAPEAGPNPFSREATIRYELGADAEVDLRVFDARGREVAHLASGVQTAGAHRAVFAAGALPGGVYVWRLSTGGAVTTGRVTLAR